MRGEREKEWRKEMIKEDERGERRGRRGLKEEDEKGGSEGHREKEAKT